MITKGIIVLSVPTINSTASSMKRGEDEEIRVQCSNEAPKYHVTSLLGFDWMHFITRSRDGRVGGKTDCIVFWVLWNLV